MGGERVWVGVGDEEVVRGGWQGGGGEGVDGGLSGVRDSVSGGVQCCL